MASARIISVNTGAIRDLAELGDQPARPRSTSARCAGRVFARRLGLAGDEQADTDHHGGPEQAIYAYAREDLDWWTEQTGREFRNGEFGENLTTSGLDISGALIGEIWQLGEDVVVQVTAPRIPCRDVRGLDRRAALGQAVRGGRAAWVRTCGCWPRARSGLVTRSRC